MNHKNSLFLKFRSFEAGAHGSFAIIALLGAILFGVGGYLGGGTLGLW